MNRQGPSFSNSSWSCSGPRLQNFVRPDPFRSKIFRPRLFPRPGPSRSGVSEIYLVLVRVGPGFLKIYCPGPSLGPNRLVRGCLVQGMKCVFFRIKNGN